MGVRFLLIRHASVDAIGQHLAGREPGIHLNRKGEMEAEELARRLQEIDLGAIYTSPLERAVETAVPMARAKNVSAQKLEELTDFDFGAWTGQPFSELERMPDWHRFNRFRASAPVPGGESMFDVQYRIVSTLESLRDRHANQAIALISHCDPIRAALLHYVGASLDCVQRIVIDPVSVSIVELDLGEPRILALNESGDCSVFRSFEQAAAK